MQLLGMPLGAVRELIPRLEAEGLLRTVPQRGLQIAHVDLKLINNAFQLRVRARARGGGALLRQRCPTPTSPRSRRRTCASCERARSGPIDDALLTDATRRSTGACTT